MLVTKQRKKDNLELKEEGPNLKCQKKTLMWNVTYKELAMLGRNHQQCTIAQHQI